MNDTIKTFGTHLQKGLQSILDKAKEKERDISDRIKVTVSVEADADGVQSILKSGMLTNDFMKAVSKAPTAQFSFSGERFHFSASREDFKNMVEQKIFPKALADAFAATTRDIRSHSVWEAGVACTKNRDQVTARAPVPLASHSANVGAMKGVVVNTRQYIVFPYTAK